MIKSGIGQDSHRFETKPSEKPLYLGGVVFNQPLSLLANSDGDVVLHALINAISSISGTIILGDVADKLCQQGITDSRVYLQAALKTLGDWQLRHIAISLECAQPKIKPKLTQMRQSIAELTKLTIKDVGITATSGEGLNACGRGEGIHVLCLISVENND